MRRRSKTDQWGVALAGLLLLGSTLAAAVHGARTAWAQDLYREAKYGGAAGDVPRVLDLCRRAYVLYPYNYYFSLLAADQAEHTSGSLPTPVAARQRHLARVWCERGLLQNRFRNPLRRLMARLLWTESPTRAIQYWEEYTQWEFWRPHNHAELAAMYAQVGDFDKAERALYWVQGDPAYETTRALIRREQAQQEAELDAQSPK